ncbi:glycosyltransferase family 2 protein [Fictibacillus sp. B-59209]|uniref:glycosyltransferase family 2 protein n=1 Tax=Fictibacillus sp. B-59209 TaxID=3024873 RepID=UPI002E239CD7|nr:glycosyltransferase family 2 protein [Fictibacillus sp. B-59209]
MENPKVSIIMGVLNGKDRILTAVDSIKEQTFEDWELIICDDGSTDGTFELLLDIAEKDQRIKPIKNQVNLGLARTLNHCLEVSKGEYIARMDDDDYSYPDRLAIQVDFLNKHPEYDIVCSAIDIFDGEKVLYKKKPISVTPEIADFLWGSCFEHPATIFRASKLREVNGYRFAKETRRAEDYDLFMRMYAAGMRGYNIEKPLLRYYVNVQAMKKRKFKYRLDEVIVRYKGFKNLGLFPKGYLYVLKPLIVSLIPKKILLKLQRNKYQQFVN